jgi:hypothetical protein
MKNIKFWDLRAAVCGIWASLTRHGGVIRLQEKTHVACDSERKINIYFSLWQIQDYQLLLRFTTSGDIIILSLNNRRGIF